ncbi:hypothetical protein HQ524_03875 [Candidatus Uhrbacteria bacterium]|nr:hypothetical protein [Candidatus Uhrbacteria bacterium]
MIMLILCLLTMIVCVAPYNDEMDSSLKTDGPLDGGEQTSIPHIGHRTDDGVVIDYDGTVWDNHIEVTHSHDPSVTPAVTIRTPGLSSLCELGIESTDSSIGPTDLVHTTKHVPFATCEDRTWLAHFIIDGRGQWVEIHVHLEGQEDVTVKAFLVPQKTYAVGANTATIYDATNGFGHQGLEVNMLMNCKEQARTWSL